MVGMRSLPAAAADSTVNLAHGHSSPQPLEASHVQPCAAHGLTAHQPVLVAHSTFSADVREANFARSEYSGHVLQNNAVVVLLDAKERIEP